MAKKIVIIGAGPTGLGAAYRLQELGHTNWEIYEKNHYVGGLATSFIDNRGFTWDIGGHVLFSHYSYVDQLIDMLLGNEYLLHQRDSWIRLLDSWVPYPFQNNVRYLPKAELLECLIGLVEVQNKYPNPGNFHEWILANFGEGISKYFMLPFNQKVWAYPLESMDTNWIAERVSVIDMTSILRNVIYEQDEREWGPNSQFKFPLHGGTGGLFSKFIPYIKDYLNLDEEMAKVDVERKIVYFANGKEITYDILINTAPLDQLVSCMASKESFLVEAAELLKHNSVLSVGIGIEKPSPSTKCWIYFPEDICCFYRATYFSNYSPNNVPDSSSYYSLMCETSHSEYQPVDTDKIVQHTIEGLINTRLIDETDKDLIRTTYVIEAEYAYPIPTLQRDQALSIIQPHLQEKGIFSRGRFGAWKYEVGNMDHSIMQGVDVINEILGA
jgi:protoporphyrinogen oxidase